MVLLVIFDVTEDEDRSEITSHIETYESWLKLSESTYLIATKSAPADVLYDLAEYVEPQVEVLLVGTLSYNCIQPYARQEVEGWLKTHGLSSPVPPDTSV